ncbi:MAG: metal-dependent transcriptional regulator [Candidatus Helarchaeota archaeon]
MSEYLKELARLPKTQVVTTSEFAKKFEVHPSTVTEHFQRLAHLKLINYTKYRGAQLTEKGIQQGNLLLWKHRILEVFFMNFLNLTQEEACLEANQIDFFVSHTIIKRLCQKLNHPQVCPCGFEIVGTFCDIRKNPKKA